MFEFAAFGFVALVWWTWPVIGAVTFSAFYLAFRLISWQEQRHDAIEALFKPKPCMRHMGTAPDGIEHWCWQQDGHAGPHHNQHGVPQDDFDVEHQEAWENEFPPDEELIVPVSPGLCTWNEDGRGNESACWKMAGHPGPHMVQDHDSGEYIER